MGSKHSLKKDKEENSSEVDSEVQSETLSGETRSKGEKRSESHSEAEPSPVVDRKIKPESDQRTSESSTEQAPKPNAIAETSDNVATTSTTTTVPFRYSELSRRKPGDVSFQMLHYHNFLQRHFHLEKTKLQLEQKKRKVETEDIPPASEDQPPKKVPKTGENQAPHVPYFSSLTLDDLLQRERELNSQHVRQALSSDVQPQQLKLFRALSTANEVSNMTPQGEAKSSSEGGNEDTPGEASEVKQATSDSSSSSSTDEDTKETEITGGEKIEETVTEVAASEVVATEVIATESDTEPKQEEVTEAESLLSKPADAKIYEETTVSVNGPYLRKNVPPPQFPTGGYGLGSRGYGTDVPVGYAGYYTTLGHARYTGTYLTLFFF